MTNNTGHRYDQSSEKAENHVHVAEIMKEKKEGEYLFMLSKPQASYISAYLKELMTSW